MKHPSSGAALLLGIVLLAGLATPQKAHALFGVGDVVLDPINLIQNTLSGAQAVISAVTDQASWMKEYVLDPIAWLVGKTTLQSMTMSIVNQVAGRGSGGSPQFITNLQVHLRGVGDRVASDFLGQLSSNGAIRSPFQNTITEIVGRDYFLSTSQNGFFERNAYTLNAVVENDRAFVSGDFSQGGWQGWFSLIEPQNNFWGSYFISSAERDRRVAVAEQTRERELGWGDGFLSWRGDCKFKMEAQELTAELPGLGEFTENPDGTFTQTGTGPSQTVSLGKTADCLEYDIETPGSVVKGGLEKALGTSLDSLVSADEINEIFSSLFSNLVISVVGGGGGGGLSGVGGSSRSRTDVTALATATDSIGANLMQTIRAQDGQIDNYEAGWQKTGVAADTAKKALETLSTTCPVARTDADKTLAEEVDPAIAGANTAVQKAAGAHAALDALRMRVATADIPLEVQDATVEYQELMESNVLPSGAEIAEAFSGGKELRMKQITEEADAELARCRALLFI